MCAYICTWTKRRSSRWRTFRERCHATTARPRRMHACICAYACLCVFVCPHLRFNECIHTYICACTHNACACGFLCTHMCIRIPIFSVLHVPSYQITSSVMVHLVDLCGSQCVINIILSVFSHLTHHHFHTHTTYSYAYTCACVGTLMNYIHAHTHTYTCI